MNFCQLFSSGGAKLSAIRNFIYSGVGTSTQKVDTIS